MIDTVHFRLVAAQGVCLGKEKLWCPGNHSQLLVLSVDRSLSPLEQMNGKKMKC